jgi:hypothetical protein
MASSTSRLLTLASNLSPALSRVRHADPSATARHLAHLPARACVVPWPSASSTQPVRSAASPPLYDTERIFSMPSHSDLFGHPSRLVADLIASRSRRFLDVFTATLPIRSPRLTHPYRLQPIERSRPPARSVRYHRPPSRSPPCSTLRLTDVSSYPPSMILVPPDDLPHSLPHLGSDTTCYDNYAMQDHRRHRGTMFGNAVRRTRLYLRGNDYGRSSPRYRNGRPRRRHKVAGSPCVPIAIKSSWVTTCGVPLILWETQDTRVRLEPYM